MIKHWFHTLRQRLAGSSSPISKPPARATGPRSPAPYRGSEAMQVDNATAPASTAQDRVSMVCSAPSTTSGQLLLTTVIDPKHLAEIAVQARFADIRYAAVQRISDAELLHRIANNKHNKDKRVHRYCVETLARLRAQQRAKERVLTLEKAFRTLLATTPLPAGKLYLLQQELANLPADLPLDTCQTLLQEARERERAESALYRDAESARSLAQGTLADLQNVPALEAGTVERITSLVTTLKVQIRQLPNWLQKQGVITQALTAVAAIEKHLATAASDAIRSVECQRFIAAQASAPVTDVIRNAWAALPKPKAAAALAAVEQAWADMLAQNVRKAPASSDRQRRRQANSPPPDVGPLLTRLEEALAHGETQQAIALRREINLTLGQARLPASLQRRLQAATEQLRTLRGWARWSAAKARTELVLAVENLLADEPTVAERSTAVPKLRADWNRLAAQVPPPADEQQRFDTLLTQAYAPVTAHRAEQAAQRSQARQHHLIALDEWEAWAQNLTWLPEDIPAIQRRWQAITQQRRQLPRLSGKDSRALAKRFATLAMTINARLDERVSESRERRERLIDTARRIAQLPDTILACEQIRRVQTEWREESKRIMLPRTEHDRLWTTFRDIADAVFARRQQDRETRELARQEQLAGRQALLDAFRVTLAQCADVQVLAQASATFETSWQAETSRPGERPSRHPLDTQAHALLSQAAVKLKQLQDAHRQEHYKTLAAKAALTQAVEQASITGSDVTSALTAAERQWQDLPSLTGDAERQLRQRLRAASKVTPEIHTRGLIERAELLLDLEILLDLPSPNVPAENRRQRQLNLLQAGRRASQAHDLPETILKFYTISAPPDPDHNARLQAILSKILPVPQN